jgi:hypothetical protein
VDAAPFLVGFYIQSTPDELAERLDKRGIRATLSPVITAIPDSSSPRWAAAPSIA